MNGCHCGTVCMRKVVAIPQKKPRGLVLWNLAEFSSRKKILARTK